MQKNEIDFFKILKCTSTLSHKDQKTFKFYFNVITEFINTLIYAERNNVYSPEGTPLLYWATMP